MSTASIFRINSNVSSLTARHQLNQTQMGLQGTLEKLSTGLRINSGADGPADLIVSERLRSEIEGVDQAIQNSEHASNVIATAEAALNEVGRLLIDIKRLTVEAANEGGLSKEEIEANQLQVDDAINSINRIANVTTFAGLKLLDGSLAYTVSGVDQNVVSDFKIDAVQFGTLDSFPIDIDVVNSAERAAVFFSAGGTGTTLASSAKIEVAGVDGTQGFEFVSGMALSQMAAAINRVSDSTGIEAFAFNGAADFASGVVFRSIGYGSDEFVQVRRVLGSAGGVDWRTYEIDEGIKTTNSIERNEGHDVSALVNGALAEGEGLEVKLRTPQLNLNVTLEASVAQDTVSGVTSFEITGGGAKFQLGPKIQASQQVNIGIDSVFPHRLGNGIDGFLDSIRTGGGNTLTSGRTRQASDVIEAVIDQISQLRGRLSAFERNTLQTNVRSTQVALENLTASESTIRDTDFARQTANLARDQVLVSVGTNMLSTANQNTQNVLQLLQ